MRKIMSAANGNASAVAVLPLRALSMHNMCGESVRFVSRVARILLTGDAYVEVKEVPLRFSFKIYII